MSEFITVGNFPDSPSAHIAKGLLEAHNIRCFLENDSLVAGSTHLSIAFGGINLKVREEDAENAKKLLTEEQKNT